MSLYVNTAAEAIRALSLQVPGEMVFFRWCWGLQPSWALSSPPVQRWRCGAQP
ncbi:hypothetical protein [Escherichia coli]|uniref:hypothetical protein n=1 Tax=Escherichia coli TaxID=562 RepID=UPI003839E836